MPARIVRALTAALLLVGVAVISAGPASAADRSDVIDTSTIKVADEDGSTDQPITQWQRAEISFEFTTQGKPAAKPGDTFGLSLPAEFDTVDLAFDLLHPDGTLIATCTATGQSADQPAKVTCTFTDGVQNADGSPKYEYLSGGVQLKAQAIRSTTEPTVIFGTANADVPVELPGNGVGIIPSQTVYPTDLEKWGWFSDNTRSELFWQIFIPASENVNELTVVDTISAGHSLSSTPQLQVLTDADTQTWQDVTEGVTLANAETGSQQFTMTIAAGTLQAGNIYRVEYFTKTTSQAIGQSYSNSVTLNGKEGPTNTQTRFELGNGYVDGPGLGSFSVSKSALAGEAAALVPAGTTFHVTAVYQLNGATVTKDLEVVADGEAAVVHGLPVGTQVTLSEATPPAIDGVEWGTPIFSSDDDSVTIGADGTTATLVVGERTTTYVQLSNTANNAPSTPPTTPSTTSTPPSTPATTSAVPAPPVTPAPPAPKAPVLAQTGVDVSDLGGLAAALLAAGLLALAAGRRRTA